MQKFYLLEIKIKIKNSAFNLIYEYNFKIKAAIIFFLNFSFKMSKSNKNVVNLLDVEFELAFKPFKFQLSLALNSCLNKNNIICVRTGAGKTLIAALICRYWYEKYSQENKLDSFKVFFIVPTRNLVHQQSLVFRKAFDKDDIIEITENYAPLKILSAFNSKKIFFLTPQKLINFINQFQIDLNLISILFLDECHHTFDSHPYNELMKIYYKNYDKFNKKPLIVGLTASIGVGNSPLDHLISLCANMDCQFISFLTSQEDINDLNKNIPSPLNDKILRVPLCKDVNDLRLNIETIGIKLADLVNINRLSINFGKSDFDQFIHNTEINASQKNDQALIEVLKYLKELNLLYQRCEDLPIEFCLEKFNDFISSSKIIDPNTVKTECKFLINHFLKNFASINFNNTKLMELVKTILQYHSGNSRGLVLVRTRNHVKALVLFLNQNKSLMEKELKFDMLVGLGCVDGISMNENQQKEIIKKFLRGDFNVLVSTDIAQEGLDIPTCNYVIRYEFVSNEIGTVQSRGRSRASNGQCILITSFGSINEKREMENRFKEEIMKKTLLKCNSLEGNEFKKKFEAEKKKILSIRNRILLNLSIFKFTGNLFCSSKIDVLCRDCGTFLFNGDNLRFREPSYYCICQNFITNLCIIDTDTKKFSCSVESCNRVLGQIVPIRKILVPYFMIEIKAIKVRMPDNQIKLFSKWKQLTDLVMVKDF